MTQEIRNDQGEVYQVQTANKPAGRFALTETGWGVAYIAAPLALIALIASIAEAVKSSI